MYAIFARANNIFGARAKQRKAKQTKPNKKQSEWTSKHANTNTHMRHRVKWINSLEFALQIFPFEYFSCYVLNFFARIISTLVLVAFKLRYISFWCFVLLFFSFRLQPLLFWRLFDCFHQSQRDLEFILLRTGFAIFKRQKHIHVISLVNNSFYFTFWNSRSFFLSLLALLFNFFSTSISFEFFFVFRCRTKS